MKGRLNQLFLWALAGIWLAGCHVKPSSETLSGLQDQVVEWQFAQARRRVAFAQESSRQMVLMGVIRDSILPVAGRDSLFRKEWQSQVSVQEKWLNESLRVSNESNLFGQELMIWLAGAREERVSSEQLERIWKEKEARLQGLDLEFGGNILKGREISRNLEILQLKGRQFL